MFYDTLAPYYHLLFQNWDASIARQGEQLAAVIAAEWPGSHRLLDVSCGIGTQALGLAALGFDVTASDLSAAQVGRARAEASKRGLAIGFSECDMREAHRHHGGGFDAVLSVDNSIAHLLTDADILAALRELHACLKPGGGCVLTLRDYAQEPRGRGLFKPYGVREEGGERFVIFQVWDFDDGGTHYDQALYIVEEDSASLKLQTHVMRSRSHAVPVARVCEIMQEAGFAKVRRIDGAFYQPMLVGTR